MRLAGPISSIRGGWIAEVVGFAVVFLLCIASPTRAQDISSIKSGLAAKICPASEYSRITYDDRGCGWSAQKACDERYRAPSAAWQDCYEKMHECRKQIDADNQVISEANQVFRECNQRKPDTNHAATENAPKPGGSVSAGNSGTSDLASRLAAQSAKSVTANDVRKKQDEQFNDTVRATQQQYQQFKAQEQAEQAAKARTSSQQRNARQNQKMPDPGCTAGAPYRGEGQSCWPTPPPNYAAPNAPVDNCTALHSCDRGCGPPSDATAACWNSCLDRYGRC